jgi:hypothetical protein
MEAVKGFIFNRGKVTVDNKELNSYLVSFMLVTDEPLTQLDTTRGETIVMGGA